MTDRIQIEGGEPDTPAASEEQATERPVWLPEKFTSPEDFAKSYQDTQAALTKAQQELATFKKADPAKAEEAPKPPTAGLEIKPEEKEPENKADAAAPVDVAVYETEFATTGEISEASREDIRVKLLGGVPRELADKLINQQIEAAKVIGEKNSSSLMAEAGGPEGYREMVSWAAKSLPADQIETFNRTVNSGDYAAASLAISGLRARHASAVGKAPNLIQAGSSTGSGNGGYTTAAEYHQALRDPKYRAMNAEGETYRADVQRKLRASKF